MKKTVSKADKSFFELLEQENLLFHFFDESSYDYKALEDLSCEQKEVRLTGEELCIINAALTHCSLTEAYPNEVLEYLSLYINMDICLDNNSFCFVISTFVAKCICHIFSEYENAFDNDAANAKWFDLINQTINKLN